MGLLLLDGGVGSQTSEGDVDPPLPPAGVFLDAVVADGFDVNWTSNSEPDIQDYRVYLSSVGPSSGFVLNATIVAPTTTHPITGLVGATQYWVYVTARDNSLNESAQSTVVTATTSGSLISAVTFLPSTETALSYEVGIINQSLTLAATCMTRFRVQGSQNYFNAALTMRIRPEWTTPAIPPRSEGFAGMVFFLEPDTVYDLEVTLFDGVTTDIQNTTITTRKKPRDNPLVPVQINTVTNTATLSSAISAAAPGHVINIPPGTYDTDGFELTNDGTYDNPIILRGLDRDTVILTNSSIQFGSDKLAVEGDNWTIEDLTLEATNSSGEVLSTILDAKVDRLTIRRCKIKGFTGLALRQESRGGVGGSENTNFSIYDNLVEGIRDWATMLIEIDSGTGDPFGGEGIELQGQGHECYQNTVSGFGDSLGVSNFVFTESDMPNIGIVIRNNWVLWGGDDGMELDDTYSHVAAYQNRIVNCANLVSTQPNIAHGGPRYAFQNIGINLHGGSDGSGGGNNAVYKIKTSQGSVIMQPGFICNNTVYQSTVTNNNWGHVQSGSTGDNINNIWFLNNLLFVAQPRTTGLFLDESGGTWRWYDYNAVGIASGPELYGHNNWAGSDTETNLAAYTALNNTALAPFDITRGVEENSVPITTADFDATEVSLPSSYTILATGGDIFPTLGSPLNTDGLALAQLSQDGGTTIGARTRGSAVPLYGNQFTGIPSYISEMATYDVRLMESTYAPTNGTSDMFSVTPSVAPRDWINSDPGTNFSYVVIPWSGGFKAMDGTKLRVHGGGHNDSGNHGHYIFDFSGDNEPVGWDTDIDISTTANAASHASTSGLDAEGRPVSVHTYDGAVYAHHNDVGYRFGGSQFSSGPTVPWSFKYDFSSRTWTTLTDAPMQSGANESLMTLYDSTTRKILVLGKNSDAAFFRCDDDTWSAVKSLVYPNVVGFDSVGAFDTTRGDVGIIVGDDAELGGASSHGKLTINFSAETVSFANQSFSGLPALSAPGVVYDSVADVYWVIGGGDGSSTDQASWSTIYSVDPVTFVATSNSLSQTIPHTGGGFSGGSGKGTFGRIVLLADWRAIGIVAGMGLPVAVIKLPSI